MKLDRYRENLRVMDGKVYSYDTHVATITSDNELLVKPFYAHYSVTTSKHINYVAGQYGLKKVVVEH